MSNDIVTMRHKDSDQPVRVLASQVENMKQGGWQVEDQDPVKSSKSGKKRTVAKPDLIDK